MLKHYFKVAYRSLVRHRGHSVINVIGLTVGFACSFLIVLWVQAELNHDRFLPEGDRVYRVWRNVNIAGETRTWGATARPLADVLAADYPEIEEVVPLSWPMEFVLGVGGETYREAGVFVGSDYFEVFQFPLLRGEPAAALQGADAAVVTERLARRLFRDEWASAVGRQVSVDFRKDFVITAIMADPPAGASFQYDIVISIEDFYARNTWLNAWGNNALTMYVQLGAGADPQDVTRKIAGIVRKNEEGADEDLFLQAFEDEYLYSEFEEGQASGGRIDNVRVLSLVALFILLIAVVNFTNLATARSVERAKEIGVRKSLGARRPSLIVQFMGESVLITCVAYVLSVGLALGALVAFKGVLGSQIALADASATLLLEGLAIALVVGVLAGAYPALYLSALQPLSMFKGGGRRSRAADARKGLVVFQFALTMFLLVATVAAYAQIDYIRSRDIGLDRYDLFYVAQEGELGRRLASVKQALLDHPSITAVTASSANPLELRRSTSSVGWPGKAEDTELETYIVSADYGFVSTLGMNVLAGRAFSREFGSDSTAYLINERLAAEMGLSPSSAVGSVLSFWNEGGTVIGVVKDFDMNSLYTPDEPVIIRLRPDETGGIFVRTAPEEAAAALAHFEEVARTFNPGYPLDYQFVDDEFEAVYRSDVLVSRLASSFALVALVISCLGLFGLVAFTAEQRAKEIGIRKVLGASVPRLVLMLTSEMTKLVVLGVVLAIPASLYAVNRWLDDFDAHVDIGVGLYFVAGGIALAIAWATVSYQALRASVADPVDSLRRD